MGGTSSTIPTPTLDGSLTVVPGFVDFHAQRNPERPWVILAADSEDANVRSVFHHFPSHLVGTLGVIRLA